MQWVTRPDAAARRGLRAAPSLTGFGETPDVFEAIFEYPDFLATWSSREVAAGGNGAALRDLRHQGHADASTGAGSRSRPTRRCRRRSQIPTLHAAAGRHRPRSTLSHRGASRTTATSRCATSSGRTSGTSSTRSRAGRRRSRISPKAPPDGDRLPPRQHRRARRTRRPLGRRTPTRSPGIPRRPPC